MFVCICLEELWILDLISLPVHSVAAVLDPRVCAVEVNEARKELFTQKSRSLENLAPTSTALEEHLKEELNDNLYMDYTSRSSKFML